MTIADINKIIRSEYDNASTLQLCKNHSFTIDLNPEEIIPILKTWRCAHCGGEVDARIKKWYELGKTHASSMKHASEETT